MLSGLRRKLLERTPDRWRWWSRRRRRVGLQGRHLPEDGGGQLGDAGGGGVHRRRKGEACFF
jgi:hypothetical protein